MNTATTRRLGSPLLLILALLPAATASAQHFPPDRDLELMLRYLVEDGDVPGVAMGVVEADGTARAVGYGSAGPGGRPIGSRSVFEIGTLTMTFTATLFADMVMRGEVALDDRVARYLPDHVTLPSPGGYRMTLGDLATHRSGLPAGPDAHADITVEDLYALVSAAELTRPGIRHEFSPIGYGLLGHALARAAGTSYPDLLRERVLEPLGMGATGYALAGAMAERLAQGHADGAVVPPAFATEAMQGATGLRASAEDMLRFLRANVGPPRTDLEKAMVVAREIRVERGRPDEELGYGFSWRTYSVAREPPIVAHGGGTSGFTAMIHFDPWKGIGTVVLANTRAFNDRIGRTLLFFDPPLSRAEARVDPAALRRYEGTYRRDAGRYRLTGPGRRYFIRLEDEGYLTYQTKGLVRTRLYAATDSSFYMLRGPLTVSFRARGDEVRMVMFVDEREPNARATSWRAWKVDEETPTPAVVAGTVSPWRAWGPRTWALIGLVGVVVVAMIVRSLLWRRPRTGTGRVRKRAAWSRPGQYP